jgi:hypothetical protein
MVPALCDPISQGRRIAAIRVEALTHEISCAQMWLPPCTPDRKPRATKGKGSRIMPKPSQPSTLRLLVLSTLVANSACSSVNNDNLDPRDGAAADQATVDETGADVVPTDGACSGGLKVCGGHCVSPLDPAYGCASVACTPCAVPANGAAACNAGKCGVACNPGYQTLGESCVAPEGGTASAVILFGGQDAASSFNDTWQWDGSTWTSPGAADAAAGPNSRSLASMAALNGKSLLFGGINGSSVFGDTWIWGGQNWTSESVAEPSARLNAAAATVNGAVVIFGGQTSANISTAVGDTWSWNGTAWTELSVAAPSARWGASMATLNGKALLFGGYAGGELGDTWTWDGTSWAQLGVPGPSPRVAPGMATLNGVIVLFGGVAHGAALGDTWTWNGTAWTEIGTIPGPSPRAYTAMATLGSTVVLFGGDSFGPAGALGDTWIWNGTGWTQFNAAGPPARYGAGIATLSGP